VFVIDTKAWSGTIAIDGGVLRQNGRRRDRSVAGAAAAALAVTELLPGLDPAMVKPVLCFAQDEPVFGWVGEVMVCSTANVVTMLTSRPTVLDPATVHTAAGLLHGPLQWAAPDASAPSSRRPRRTRSRTRPPSRPGARRRRPSPVRSVLGLLALGVLAVFAATLVGPFAHVVEVEARERLHPATSLGTTVTVNGNPLRPELQVLVEDVRTSRVLRPRPLAQSRPRLLVAEVTIRNTGETAWTARRDTRVVVVDEDGVEHGRHPRVREVRAGNLLPAHPRLEPRHSVHGFVAFNAPPGFDATRVRVYVDPGMPRPTDWTLRP
jgi:hypothetical protein